MKMVQRKTCVKKTCDNKNNNSNLKFVRSSIRRITKAVNDSCTQSINLRLGKEENGVISEDSLAKRLMEIRDVATGAAVETKRLLFTRLVNHLWGGHWTQKHKATILFSINSSVIVCTMTVVFF